MIGPNSCQLLSSVYTQPAVPPEDGSESKVISPTLPAVEGVETPTVYFLPIVSSPWMNRLFASTGAFVVTFLLKTTGPLNSEIIFLSLPPSTFIPRLTVS